VPARLLSPTRPRAGAGLAPDFAQPAFARSGYRIPPALRAPECWNGGLTLAPSLLCRTQLPVGLDHRGCPHRERLTLHEITPGPGIICQAGAGQRNRDQLSTGTHACSGTWDSARQRQRGLGKAVDARPTTCWTPLLGAVNTRCGAFG